jgi:hypothetical protein
MQSISKRLQFLFASTKGLILMAIAAIALVTAVFGMLSGPMAEWGVREVVVRLLRMDLIQAEREGRIIILYHSIAMAVIAIETYMITGLLKLRQTYRAVINAGITIGYLATMIFGLLFAYWGHVWPFHGLYIAGLTMMFASGVLLCVALWPWDREFYIKDNKSGYARTPSGFDLERAAFFAMALTTVISSMFGAVAGSYFGNGFEVFLAENIIREPEKTVLEYSVIGHLHIMLALIAIAITLIIGRWLDFKGTLQKIAMPLMLVGVVVLNLGVWGVVTPLEPIAHMIIYVGATPAMLAALMLVIFGFDKFIREGLRGIKRPTFGHKLSALVRDPLKFGPLWQMIFMNFTVSGIGILMAVRLDEIFRVWPAREERIELTGHWHVLSAIIATIILFYYGDLAGLKGRVRQWYGWLIIVLSDTAFAAVTLFEMKRLYISEVEQQPLVNTLMLGIDIGLGSLLVVLAALMVWRLIDLFKERGLWAREASEKDLYEAAK